MIALCWAVCPMTAGLSLLRAQAVAHFQLSGMAREKRVPGTRKQLGGPEETATPRAWNLVHILVLVLLVDCPVLS